ncbi:hypothetical protein Plec18170_007744 [Paecilomyces lecythidis]
MSMDGANTDGGSDGTGDFFVGSEIFAPHSNTVTGVGPINMVFPPSTLKNPTTLYPGPFITSLEIAHPMTTTITAHGTVTVTTTMTRVIETTTIPLAPITLGAIPWWNWNITSHNKTNESTVLFPSIEIGPVAISDNFSAFNISMASPTTTSNRTIIVPPWPWSTTSLSTTVPHGKTVHFTEDLACLTVTWEAERKVDLMILATLTLPINTNVEGLTAKMANVMVPSVPLLDAKVMTAIKTVEEKVDICTEFVYSQPDTARSTSTTKTSTSCDTITACSATATTTTTTLTENSSYDEPFYAWEAYTNTAVIDAVASEIDAAFRSAESSWERPTTTSATSKTTTSKTSTSTGPAATSKNNTTPDEVSYTCSAKSVIRGSVVYGTTSANSNTGECYTDGMNAGFGCGIFVKGDDCQILGTTMQAAYDHLMDKNVGGCTKCGQVTFSNGCTMRVDYVSGCSTTNNGPVQLVSLNGSIATTAMSPATLASSQYSSAEISWSVASNATSM